MEQLLQACLAGQVLLEVGCCLSLWLCWALLEYVGWMALVVRVLLSIVLLLMLWLLLLGLLSSLSQEAGQGAGAAAASMAR